MKVLIKLGGTLLDEARKRSEMAEQLSWAARNCELAVVHGGGKEVTKFLEERSIRSEFINGLRVSAEEVIDAVTKVIAGGVNKRLVASLIAAGCPAVGISGVDGGMVSAKQLSAEYKFTGKPTAADGRLLDVLIGAGYLPVVACIAGDTHGQIFNVNADQLAVSCAAGWGAEKLFFLTDVSGVKNGNGDTISAMTPSEVRDLVSSGVAHGGMQAKLEASLLALESGINEVVIARGTAENICRDLLSGRRCGTSLSMQKAGVA